MNNLLRAIGTVCAFMVTCEALLLVDMFARVSEAGLLFKSSTGPGQFLMAIAPFGITSFVGATLVAVVFWFQTYKSNLSIPLLIFPVALATFGMVALAVGMEIYKEFSSFDGGERSIGQWLSNTLLIGSLLALVFHSWRQWKVERGHENDED